MQANADKLRKLHAMGLGPVWQRRGLLEQAVPTSTAGADEAIAAMDWDALCRPPDEDDDVEVKILEVQAEEVE